MHIVREISTGVFWVGGSDRRMERFENLFPIPNGIAYNSYLILDEKTALLDTVDSAISELFLQNVEHALCGRKLDYLIVNHMEPDHCASIERIVRLHPGVRVVGNAKTFQFFDQYYRMDITGNRLEVQQGQEIPLGEHTLRFYAAPMVHWPEVMMTYETKKGILFSADAFGSFGAHSGNLFADEVDFNTGFLDEARRYYANIVGRYGSQVQEALKKLADIPIHMICPLHGLIWRKSLGYILEKYDRWSRYMPEKNGVLLFYASMYGNTENAMSVLANKLAQRGVTDMRMYDVSKTHASYIISDAWKYSHLAIGGPTYNMNLYFMMDALLHEMAVLGLRNRKAALLGNHTWASAAIRQMQEIVGGMKEIEIIGTPLDIKSSFKPEREAEMDVLADGIKASLDATNV